MAAIVWREVKAFKVASSSKEILCYLEHKYDTPEKKHVFARQLDAFLQQFKTPQPQ